MQTVEGTRCHHGAERTIRCLQLAQLFRSSQWAFTNAAATTLALSLTGGDSARVVRMMSVSISVASALELLFTPWIGRYMDRAGRKPLLVVAAAVKSLPYAMNVFRPSLLAIFLEGCIDSTAYQLYSLAESTLVAEQIKERDFDAAEEEVTGMYARFKKVFDASSPMGKVQAAVDEFSSKTMTLRLVCLATG